MGQDITDTAALANGFQATGSITFNLYGPDDANCSGPATSRRPRPSTGNGSYTTSPGFSTSEVGTYRWIASYPGRREQQRRERRMQRRRRDHGRRVRPSPSIATNATASATVGDAVSDTATLSGGFNASGTITFDVYGPDDPTCSGAPAFTDTETVSGNGSVHGFAELHHIGGRYLPWIASYSGTRNKAATGACNDAERDDGRPADPLDLDLGRTLNAPSGRDHRHADARRAASRRAARSPSRLRPG